MRGLWFTFDNIILNTIYSCSQKQSGVCKIGFQTCGTLLLDASLRAATVIKQPRPRSINALVQTAVTEAMKPLFPSKHPCCKEHFAEQCVMPIIHLMA